MGLDAIIFDVDGGFAATGDAHRQAFNKAFVDTGVDWRWSRAAQFALDGVGGPAAKLAAFAKMQEDPPLTPDLEREILERQAIHLHALAEEGITPLRPGVARLVREARSRSIAIGILSLNGRQFFELLVLNYLGISALEWFDVIVSDHELGASGTPDVAYRLATQALGVDPSRAFAIDGTPTGVRAARQAGLNVIATPSFLIRGENLDGAHLVLTDLGHPAAPFHVIRGQTGMHPCVSVAALSEWVRGQMSVA